MQPRPQGGRARRLRAAFSLACAALALSLALPAAAVAATVARRAKTRRGA